jgi:flagellar hook-basal body complex protein FliE
MPVDPVISSIGPEWQIGGLGDSAGTAGVGEAAEGESGFAGALTDQIQKLADTQAEGAEASRALAEGTASDPAEVVMAVERARLSMQLASQIRTKAVEAAQDIFHTTV